MDGICTRIVLTSGLVLESRMTRGRITSDLRYEDGLGTLIHARRAGTDEFRTMTIYRHATAVVESIEQESAWPAN